MKEEMVILTRSFDFLDWLMQRALSFPRSQRFAVTQRLQDAALDFHESIVIANHQRTDQRLERLEDADAALDRVRHYLRLIHRWRWLSDGQYHHVAEMIAELGRLLGGWIQETASRRQNLGRGAGPETHPRGSGRFVEQSTEQRTDRQSQQERAR